MKAESRQRSFLLGRAALRSLLAELTNSDPGRVELEVMENGLVTAPKTDYHVSISHSGNRATAVVSRRRVGVDIEQIVERPESLLRYVLHEDEFPHIEALPVEESHRLFLCWTIKEAVLKAIGTGLLRSPKSVRLDIDYESSRAFVKEESGYVWHVQFEQQDEYMFALAVEPDASESGKS
jgi:4'-phosphopantetheinyl transferase